MFFCRKNCYSYSLINNYFVKTLTFNYKCRHMGAKLYRLVFMDLGDESKSNFENAI